MNRRIASRALAASILFGVAHAAACAKGGDDLPGITPVDAGPRDGALLRDVGVDLGLPVDTGVDLGSTVTDTGVDLGSSVMDTGVDVGGPMDAGVDLGGPMDAGYDAGATAVTCPVDLPNACANASTQTVTVGPGEEGSVSGVVDSRGDDYFLVQFTSPGGATSAFRPVIEFTTNPSNSHVFSLETMCGVEDVACAGDRTTYSMNFPGDTSGCVSNCSDMETRPTQYIVRVKRVGVPNNCFRYTIRVAHTL